MRKNSLVKHKDRSNPSSVTDVPVPKYSRQQSHLPLQDLFGISSSSLLPPHNFLPKTVSSGNDSPNAHASANPLQARPSNAFRDLGVGLILPQEPASHLPADAKEIAGTASAAVTAAAVTTKLYRKTVCVIEPRHAKDVLGFRNSLFSGPLCRIVQRMNSPFTDNFAFRNNTAMAESPDDMGFMQSPLAQSLAQEQLPFSAAIVAQASAKQEFSRIPSGRTLGIV
jgi:hypothetical protein